MAINSHLELTHTHIPVELPDSVIGVELTCTCKYAKRLQIKKIYKQLN